MAETRIVKIKTQTETLPIEVNTDARTLGELKEVVQEFNSLKKIDWKNVSVIERSTRKSLELDTSVLEPTDTFLFISPKKTKAGASYPYKLAKAIVKELVEAGEIGKVNYRGITTAKLNEIIEENKEYFEGEPDENGSNSGSVTIAVKGVDPENVTVVSFNELGSKPEPEVEVVVIEMTTLEDIEQEHKEIMDALKK